MRPYMLDTNIVSNLIRHPDGPAARKIAGLDPKLIVVSVIVASESRFGALRKNSEWLTSGVEDLFSTIDILPLEDPASHHYARIRRDLEAAGTPISQNDMLIAAHALSIDAILVTDNVREFSRVAGLSIENWLRD